ncbi:MAG: hypothetical protein WDA25_11435, partial [Paracoccaceae bacterium]
MRHRGSQHCKRPDLPFDPASQFLIVDVPFMGDEAAPALLQRGIAGARRVKDAHGADIIWRVAGRRCAMAPIHIFGFLYAGKSADADKQVSVAGKIAGTGKMPAANIHLLPEREYGFKAFDSLSVFGIAKIDAHIAADRQLRPVF